MRQLTDAEMNTIAQLATIAAEHYEQNARELRVTGDEAKKEAYESLAKQFDRQVVEATAIATMFGEMPPVMIGNCRACMAAEPDHSTRDCPDRRLLALIEGRL